MNGLRRFQRPEQAMAKALSIRLPTRLTSCLPTRPRRWTSTILLLGCLCGAGAAVGEIRIKTLPDGSKMISNETAVQHSRRVSGTLVKVPNQRIDLLISQYARQRGLDPRLVQAVVQVESGYNPKALSSKGAQGLMQLMPDTARELKVDDAFDPEQNIRGGTLYLLRMIQRYDSVTLGLAAYNAGPTAVDRYDGIPPYRETRNYVRKVLSLYHGDRRGQDLAALQPMARVASKTREKDQKLRDDQKRQGGKVYLTRDENNRIVFTTAPPDEK